MFANHHHTTIHNNMQARTKRNTSYFSLTWQSEMKGFCSSGSSSPCNNSGTKVLPSLQAQSHFNLAKREKKNMEK